MQLDPFKGPGSTPSRRKFWSQVAAYVNAHQKVEGKNVSIDVHHGYGSVINVNPQRQGSGPPPTTCPPTNPCTVDVEIILPTIGTNSVTDKPVSGDGSEDPDHWIAFPWESSTECTDQCSQFDPCTATTCQARMRWRFPDGTTRIIIIIDRVIGDSVLADGWYIDLSAIQDDTCTWNTIQCSFLGASDSIFATDLSLSFPITSTCGDGTVNLVFHPC